MTDCGEVQNILWPADELRVSDAQVEAALEHAESCPDCQRFLEDDRRVAEIIRESVPRVRAPRELRERLYTALARERAGGAPIRSRGRRTREMLVAAAAIAALAVAAGYWLANRTQPARAAIAFADDYLRRVVEQEELESSDRTEIASFFGRELGVAMSPPEVPDLEIQRAAICLMNGRRGGVVEYSGSGKQLTYYLLPDSGDSRGELHRFAASRESVATSTSPAVAEERGLGVATWWDDDHQHALVGNLPENELKRLTPLFACPTSRSLAGP